MSAARRHTCKLAAVVVACLPVLANAGLNIDIRATALNGVALSGGNTPRNVTVARIGDVVWFDIFAVIVGTNAVITDDKFVSVAGSFKSAGPIQGTLFADVVPTDIGDITISPGFDGLGSSVGTQQDLDGDGDLDVGSNVDTFASHFWAARFALAPSAMPVGSTNPLTGGRRIGFGTFTVTAIPSDPSSTLLNFFGRNADTAANYRQDNIYIRERSYDGLLPLQILTPEPAAAWIAFAGLGFVCRHRRAHSGCATRGETR